MASDGIYWYTDPEVIAQKFSAASATLGPLVGTAVSHVVDEAAEIMRQRVLTGGVFQRAYTGGPRIDTGAMFNSIDSHVTGTGSGRVRGDFGFTDSPPYWTIFQEDGTRTGILPLNALAMATEHVRRTVAEEISAVDIWRNFR
jgi:hypothetical protein